MRNMKFYGCIASLPALLASAYGQQVDEQTRPNIILLLTDDQRWDALGYAGNQYIHTPNLDSLAGNGVYFPNTYATTSISCVSRASILTGMHMSAHGISDFRKRLSGKQEESTYSVILRNDGYYTGFIGKYGVGLAKDYPVKRYDFWRSFPGQGWYWEEGIEGRGEHLTVTQGKQIIEFLESRDREKPFCLSVSFKAPHCQDEMRTRNGEEFPSDPRDKDLYSNTEFPFPKTGTGQYYDLLPEDFRRSPSTGKENEARVRWEKRFATDSMYQKTVADYYRLISGVDRQVGIMLAELQRQGVADNTVIVFMSDNGFYLSEHGLAGKWFTHEESVRVPLFIYDPRLPAKRKGSVVEKIALNIDIAPTILSLAKAGIPPRMQGKNLARLMKGDVKDWRTGFYYEHTFSQGVYLPPSEGIVGGRYKLTRYFPGEREWYELYDLRKDPYETENLAENPAYTSRMKKLKSEMNALKAEAKSPAF